MSSIDLRIEQFPGVEALRDRKVGDRLRLIVVATVTAVAGDVLETTALGGPPSFILGGTSVRLIPTQLSAELEEME